MATGLNLDAFHAAQQRTEAAAARGDMQAAQITPWEWQQLGGTPEQYGQLYGPNSFFNANGSLTDLGQRHNLQATSGYNRGWWQDPATGTPVAPGTGTWMTPYNSPIAPGMQWESPEQLASTAEQYARWNAQLEGQMNRVNELTPFGNATYTQDPMTGQWVRSTNLSAWQQRQLEQQQARDYYTGQILQGKQNQIANQGAFSYAGIPEISGREDMLAERKRVEDLVYQNMLARFQPEFEKQNQEFAQSMADRGITAGTPIYNREYQLLKQSQNDSLQNAQAQATAEGRTEFTTNYDVQKGLREMGTKEYGEQRYAPYNEAAQLLGSQKDLILPQFQNITSIDTQKVDPAQIGQTWRNQDISKWIADLDAKTRIEVAQIQAEAAKYAVDAEEEGGEPSPDFTPYTYGGQDKLRQQQNAGQNEDKNTNVTTNATSRTNYNPTTATNTSGQDLRNKMLSDAGAMGTINPYRRTGIIQTPTKTSSKANSGYGGVQSYY